MVCLVWKWKTYFFQDPTAETEDSNVSEELTDAVLKAVETSEVASVKKIPASELRRIIEKVTREMILPTRNEIRSKIKDKELAYLDRIGKIQVK